MKIYLVIYSDYDRPYEIKGVFRNIDNARKCEEYEQMLVDKTNKERGAYGRYIEFIELDCCDHLDFDAKISYFKEQEILEQQAKENAIRDDDMKEFYRIKDKYGL